MNPRHTLTPFTALTVGLLWVVQAPPAVGAEAAGAPPAVEAAPDRGPGSGGESGVRGPGGPQGDGQGRAERRGGKNAQGGKGGRTSSRGSEPMPLSEDQVEDAIALMIELDPEIAPRIEKLRAERPEQLRHQLTRRFPRLGYMLKLKESRPDVYALRVSDIRLENLSRRLASALASLPEGDPGVGVARAALRVTLEEHFVVRNNVRRVELAGLRERLAKMEAKLSLDEGRPEAMVQERLDQLEAKPPPPAEGGDPDRRRGRREGPGDDGRRGDAPGGAE